jgi:hypothetical protein
MGELPVAADAHGDYVVWDMRDWTGDRSVLGDIETAWREEHQPSEVSASVVVLPEGLDLGPEFQDHITERWSSLADAAGIDTLVFVTERVAGLAIKSNMETEDVTVETATTVEDGKAAAAE